MANVLSLFAHKALSMVDTSAVTAAGERLLDLQAARTCENHMLWRFLRWSMYQAMQAVRESTKRRSVSAHLCAHRRHASHELKVFEYSTAVVHQLGTYPTSCLNEDDQQHGTALAWDDQ